LPDDAQQTIKSLNTRPDFIYKSTQTAIYIDGPHHEKATQQKIDEELTSKLENSGITVIRFPKEKDSWPSIIQSYPDIFGAVT